MAKLWANQTDVYEIETESYSGPLDLLLDLIQREELDITKLALARVTDKFLAYIQSKEDSDPESISEFVVIASKLIQIKSEAMLPRPPIRQDEEEDPGEALARQLLLYREIKRATAWMTDRMGNDLRGHLHVPQKYPINVQFDLEGIDLQDLIVAIENLLKYSQNLPPGVTISIPKMTLKRKVQQIIEILHTNNKTDFLSLLGDDHSRLNTIVVFLALLELVKQRMVITSQGTNFANIDITAQTELFNLTSVDLPIED